MLWTGEKNRFAVTSMDLDAMHGLVSAQMTAHPIAPTVMWVLVIVVVVWLNARKLRHDVMKFSAT
jgi:hypothetical protein